MIPGHKIYTGPERRQRERRMVPDRRTRDRYELDKSPCRSGRDRRESISDWFGTSIM